MTSVKKGFEQQILDKLDLILKVLCLNVGQDASITERALLLKQAGMSVQQISEVLNISRASVSTLTSRAKKLKK